MRKAVPFIAVVVLLFASAPPAAASSGTLYVTSDTTLTEDHYGNILIDADNVTLDCAGHTVFGPGAPGFNGGIDVAGGHTGVTVERCAVTGFDVNGIYAGETSDGRYEANTLYGNGNHGLHLHAGSGNVVVGNTSRSNGALGIVLTQETRCLIKGNTVQDNANWAGVALFDGSHGNVVTDNTASGNATGIELDDSSQNVLQRNLAEGNPFAGFYLVSSSGNSFTGNTAQGNGTGLGMHGSSGNVFAGNRFLANGPDGWGVWVADSSNDNQFVGNISRGNDYENFALAYGSSGNQLLRNVSQGSNHEGISLFYGAEGNQIRANVITGNAHSGVLVHDSSHNSITDNRVMGNDVSLEEQAGGIALRAGSSLNEVLRNVACRNGNADGYDDGSGSDNVWSANVFCTTSGI